MRKYRAENKVATIEAYAKENPTEHKSTTEKKIQMLKRKSLSQNNVEVGEKVNKLIYPSKQYNPFSNLRSKNNLYQNGKIHFHQILQKRIK